MLAEQLLQYTRQLELRISQMEEERDGFRLPLQQQPQQLHHQQQQQQQQQQQHGSGGRPRPPRPPPYSAVHHQRALELGIRAEEVTLPFPYLRLSKKKNYGNTLEPSKTR